MGGGMDEWEDEWMDEMTVWTAAEFWVVNIGTCLHDASNVFLTLTSHLKRLRNLLFLDFFKVF